jgi:hypothetical protein
MMKALSARIWTDELSDEELKEHAKDSNNFGRSNPSEAYKYSSEHYIPKSETLMLHWDFTNVSTSDNNGNIPIVYDLTSGTYGLHSGAGYGFESSIPVGKRDLVYASVQQLPENLYSSQLIDILVRDDNYTNVSRPQKYFFALENSMYDVISKNMLNLFATVIEFNNFIGEPMNAYKTQYSRLKHFRKVFFSKVENIPDLDNYVGVYKWIDDALDSILCNLIPASANASERVRTVIENHILERNKINYPLVPDKSVKVIGNGKIDTGAKDLKSIYDEAYANSEQYSNMPDFIPSYGSAVKMIKYDIKLKKVN